MLLIGKGERKYGRVALWLKAHVPDDSIIVASQFSGSAYYYTPYVVMRPEELAAGAAAAARAAVLAQHRPIYSVTFPFEQDSMKALPGKWVPFWDRGSRRLDLARRLGRFRSNRAAAGENPAGAP